MCDPFRIKTLNRSDGPSVVSKLGVVVILDHERLARSSPVDEGKATGWRHHDSGRKLVGRGDQYGIGVEGRELVRAKTIVVNWTADEPEPGLPDSRPQLWVRRGFHRNGGRVPFGQDAADQIETVAEPLCDDDSTGVHSHSAHSCQVGT